MREPKIKPNPIFMASATRALNPRVRPICESRETSRDSSIVNEGVDDEHDPPDGHEVTLAVPRDFVSSVPLTIEYIKPTYGSAEPVL